MTGTPLYVQNISVYPGESISLEITLLDQLDIPTVGTVEFLYQPKDMSVRSKEILLSSKPYYINCNYIDAG